MRFAQGSSGPLFKARPNRADNLFMVIIVMLVAILVALLGLYAAHRQIDL